MRRSGVRMVKRSSAANLRVAAKRGRARGGEGGRFAFLREWYVRGGIVTICIVLLWLCLKSLLVVRAKARRISVATARNHIFGDKILISLR